MKPASMWLVAIAVGLSGCGEPETGTVNGQARQTIASGDLNAAVVALKAHLATQPDAAESRFLLGTALAAGGNAAGAEVELRKALALQHPPDQVVPDLARAMLALGQQKKLIEEFGNTTLGNPQAQAGLLVALGGAHARLGQTAAAEAAYQRAMQAVPQHSAALLGLARLRATGGQQAEAMQQIDAVLAASPSDADAWLLKGDLLRHGQKQPEQAVAAYRKAIEARASFVPAHQAIIETFLEARDVEAARAQHRTLAKLAPNLYQTRFIEAQLAYVDGDLPKARSLVQQLLVNQPDNYRTLILQGAVAMAMGEHRLAETSLTKAVRQGSDQPLGRTMLAQAYLRTGQHAEALVALAPLLNARPENPTALTLAGQAQVQAGNYGEADELYRRAMQASPGDADVRTAAAAARMAKGDTNEALKDLYAVAATEGGDAADLMIIAAQQRRGDLAAALKAAQALAVKQPRKALPLDLAGRVLLAMNDRAGARSQFEQALVLEPQYFPATLALAMLDVAEAKPADARKRLNQVLQSQPRHSSAQMALIELDISEKAAKDGVAKSLADLIARDPHFVPARLKLIQLHLAANAPKLAVSAAQDAVSLAPYNAEYVQALARAQLAAGDAQQAVGTFSKLVGLLPNRAAPLIGLAEAQLVQENGKALASATLRRALIVAPADVDLHRRLIVMAIADKQPEKALELARRLQRQQPRQAHGYLFEAEFEASRGNWAASVAALRSAMTQAPDQARPAAVRLVVAQVAAGRPTEARAASDAWMAGHPKDSWFLVETGDLLLLRKDYAAAEQQFAAAAQLLPNVATVHNNLAWAMLKQRKPRAVEPARQAVALAPGNAIMLDTYAVALAAAGQLDQGIEAARQAVNLKPDAHGFRLNLARLYLQAKRQDEAKAELAKLQALGPEFAGNAELKQVLASIGQQ